MRAQAAIIDGPPFRGAKTAVGEQRLIPIAAADVSVVMVDAEISRCPKRVIVVVATALEPRRKVVMAVSKTKLLAVVEAGRTAGSGCHRVQIEPGFTRLDRVVF